MIPRHEHFAHGADIGVRGIGRTREEAFEQAARALTAVVVDLAAVERRETAELVCESADVEVLLIDWLDALIFELSARGRLFAEFHVAIDGTRLTARALGERVDPARHEPAVEPKAATFTELRVARQDDGSWLAQCVIDV